MASVVVTIKVMPEGPDSDLNAIYEKACAAIRAFVGEQHKDDEIKKEEEPIGFGLKALKLLFIMDEDVGSPDALEEQLRQIEHVQSVETVDVRRAVG